MGLLCQLKRGKFVLYIRAQHILGFVFPLCGAQPIAKGGKEAGLGSRRLKGKGCWVTWNKKPRTEKDGERENLRAGTTRLAKVCPGAPTAGTWPTLPPMDSSYRKSQRGAGPALSPPHPHPESPPLKPEEWAPRRNPLTESTPGQKARWA